MSEPRPVPIRVSEYNYEVTLGSVMDRSAISWDHMYQCKTWEQVSELVGMWNQTEDYPAVEVNTVYTGRCGHD